MTTRRTKAAEAPPTATSRDLEEYGVAYLMTVTARDRDITGRTMRFARLDPRCVTMRSAERTVFDVEHVDGCGCGVW